MRTSRTSSPGSRVVDLNDASMLLNETLLESVPRQDYRLGDQNVFELDTSWFHPELVVFDFDFYRLFFLNLETISEFRVSTLELVIGLQRLGRLLGLPVARRCVSEIANLEDKTTRSVDWSVFESAMKSFESRHRFGKSRSSIDSAELNLIVQTKIRMTITERVFATLDDGTGSAYGLAWFLLQMIAIVIGAFGVIFESMPEMRDVPSDGGEPEMKPVFFYISILTVGVFTFDFLARLGLVGFVRRELFDRNELIDMATGRKRFILKKTFFGRVLRFLTSPASIIDLVSFLPFFVLWTVNGEPDEGRLQGYTVFRLLRLLRVGKIFGITEFRRMKAILEKALRNSGPALGILISMCLVIALFFAVLVYIPEGGEWYSAGSEVNGGVILVGGYYRYNHINTAKLELTPFNSIPSCMWWAIVTATTVGYGDLFPTSFWGRVIGSGLALTGVLVVALPVAVVGLNFSNEYTRSSNIYHHIKTAKDRDYHERLFAKFTQGEGVIEGN